LEITCSILFGLSDSLTEREIERATEGLSFDCFNLLYKGVLPANKENALTICDYTSALKSEINSSDEYRKTNIFLLCSYYFSKNLNFSRKQQDRTYYPSWTVFVRAKV